MTPWGDFNISFLDLHTCAGTHTHAQTHIYMPKRAFLSELHLAILLLSAPSVKKEFPILRRDIGENLISTGLSQTGRHGYWTEIWYVTEGGGWYLAGSIFFSLECGAFAPHYKALQDQIILLYHPSHNGVHLPFPVSSLKIWQVNLNQSLR